MCRTEKQLIIGVALLLFTGLMIVLWWSLWGDPQLGVTSQPRRVRGAGDSGPQTKVVVTAVQGQLTVAEFDLCDVIECYGSANVWRGHNVYMCNTGHIPQHRVSNSDYWCATWDRVLWSTGPGGWTATPRASSFNAQAQMYFSLTRAQVGGDAATGKVNPLILTIKNTTKLCFDISCGSSGWTYFTLGVDVGGADPLGLFSVKFGMATSNATSAHAPVELSGHQLVTYFNITGPEDVVQIETGYVHKNVWLDWIAYTAKSNDMTECVACSTARPTLFTVPAPLLFWEDRRGFDFMLQLHMKERVDHDCITLSTLFPVVRKGVTPPVFSPRAGNYTCLTRVSVTPIGTLDESWCDKVIDVTEWANMSSINVARADLFWWCGDKILRDTLPSGWSGACAVVRLALPIVLAGSHATAQTHVGRTRRATSKDFDLTKNSPTYIDCIGVPRGVPDEYKLANQVAGGFESIFLWITPNKNVDSRAGPYYTVHGNTGTMLGSDKKMKYRDRIWVKRACAVPLFSYAHSRKSTVATENEPELVCKSGATSVMWNSYGVCPSDTQQSTFFFVEHASRPLLLLYLSD
uniref:Membrane-associated protein n=1 Tax=Oreochromis aureus TaxID=47969 RepID=A0A668RH12_OREAU